MAAVAEPGLVYRLRCLGPAILVAPDENRVRFETRKLIPLLYYLARVPGRPVSRDELTDLFWPGDDERKARHSLSQAVSLINKSLRAEAIVPAGASRLALVDGIVWLDVREFERLVADGQFIEARELWAGTLFGGYWVSRAPRLEEWIATERGRLERTFRRVLHELIEEHRASGDHEMMRREAEALLDIDELDEKAMLGYLQALTLLGDRTLALRRYGEFQKRIEKELEATPCEELRTWATRQRRGGTLPAPVTRVLDQGSLPQARPLFGRNDEFALLWGLWERTQSGQGAFVILEGPAGIGKSALGAKVANQAHVAGGAVCFAKCYRSEKPVPFAPVTTLVNQLSRLPGFLGVSAESIGELSRLHPELRQRFPNVPLPMVNDDLARHRLCDAVVDSTKAVSDEHPLLVFVDDVPDADEASLALFHFLGRQTSHMAVMLLCTTRTGVVWSEAERTFVDTARTGRLAQFVPLSFLSDPEIVRLATQVLAQRGFSPTEQAIDGILARAAGNPLQAIEAAMAASIPVGRVAEPIRGVGATTRNLFAESALERLRNLTENGRLVASALAVAGRPLSEYETTVASRLPAAELATAIAELEREGFVKHHAGNLAFVHEQYQTEADSIIGPAIRQALHLALADHLSRAAAGNGSLRFELAKHLREGGKKGQARRQALLAANYAASVGAIRSKADALQLVFDLGNDASGSTAVELGRCYLILNEFDELRSLCESAPQESTPDFRYFELAASLLSGKTPLNVGCGQLLDLVDHATRGYTMEPEAHLLLLRVADKTFDYALVRRIGRRLRRSFSPAYGDFATAYVYSKYYWAHRALPYIESALTAAQRERNWTVEQLCRDGLGIILKQVGRYRDSLRQFEYSLGLARKTMNPHAEIACLQNRAVTEMCMGDYERMAATHAEIDLLGSATWALKKHQLYNDALVDLYTQKYERATSRFGSCYDECIDAGFPLLAMQCAAGSALVSQRAGDLSGVHEAVTKLRALRPANAGMSCSWVDWAAIAYQEALNEGRVAWAIEMLDRRCRELAKRDVSYWLALEEELLRLKACTGYRMLDRDRDRLVELGARFEAHGVLAAATSICA